MDEEESEAWLKKHLKASYEPLLEEPWALDMDTTVKPLYGHQEDAKGGLQSEQARTTVARLSQLLSSRNLRIVLDVEVQAGNQTASSFAQPELWAVAGWTAGGEPSSVSARRLRLGNGAGDGRSRAAPYCVPVQAEAERRM